MNKLCYFHFILKSILSIVLNSMPRNYPDVVNRQVFRSMNHPSNSSTFENLWLEPGIWSLSQFSESWTVYNQFLVSKKAWMLNHCITLLEDILIHKWDRNLSQDSGECGTIRSQNSTEVLTGWTCSAQALSTYTWGLDKSVPAHSSTQFLASILESHCKTPPEMRKRKQWVLEWKKKRESVDDHTIVSIYLLSFILDTLQSVICSLNLWTILSKRTNDLHVANGVKAFLNS